EQDACFAVDGCFDLVQCYANSGCLDQPGVDVKACAASSNCVETSPESFDTMLKLLDCAECSSCPGACPLVDTCSTGGGGTGGSTGFTCDSCINQAWGACQQPYDACL